MSPNRNMNRDYPIDNSPILKYAVPLSPRACFNLSDCVLCLVWKMHSCAHRWLGERPIAPQSGFLMQPRQLPPSPSWPHTETPRHLPNT